MKTYLVKGLDTRQLQQVDSLLHLLSPRANRIDAERVSRLIAQERIFLFVAEDENHDIIGMLTLCPCQTLAKEKLWIEDVIVDDNYRGRGIGRLLVQEAISHAKSIAPGNVLYLTSNPTRKAARTLYKSEGFEEYETGVFRMKL